MKESEYSFSFRGYPEYQEYLPKIEKIIQSRTDQPFPLVLALNEAVCNAAKYSVAGPLNAEITVSMRIICSSIIIAVSARTIKFNALAYKKKLEKIAQDNGNKVWTDYVGIDPVSRGFWIMLSAVDYLAIKDNGNVVKLFFNIDRLYDESSKKIAVLVRKFMVEKDGVYL